MVKQFLKIAGVRSEKEFYKKYPTKESFFRAHPDAEMLEMAMYGGAYQMGGGMAAGATQQDMSEQEQIIQFVAQSLQQGADPQEILQQLVQAGIPEDQGAEIIQAVAQQLQEMMAAPQQQMMQKGGSTYSAGVFYRHGGTYVPTYADMAYNPYGAMFAEGGSFDNPGFKALPPQVQAKIMSASKKMVGGDLKVGGEYEMTQEEVDDLIRRGYKVKRLSK